MDRPVILSALRTPIGKFRGRLSGISATELGAVAIAAALRDAGADPSDVEEVIMGNVLGAGVGQAPARQAALKAGLPPTVAALTINKVCGSGLKAVMLAAQAIRAGDAELVIAGGMESMSLAPYLLRRDGPTFGDRSLIDVILNDGLLCAYSAKSMGQIADFLAVRDVISRADQDAYALESHIRATRANQEGAFNAEIIPVKVEQGRTSIIVDTDEGPRADTDPSRLAALSPAFGADGTVTAGNASMISDGAAAVVVASSRYAERTGRKPLAHILAAATTGANPEDLFIAPVDAIRKAVDRAGLHLNQIDRVELNEAFAVQVIACRQRLGLGNDRVNVNGGAIALGHPVGASGARVLVTLLNSLQHCGGRYGVASLCLGGGNAVAMIVERINH